MNELIKSIERRDGGTHIDNLAQDPELSTLFGGYLNATPGGDVALTALEKHKSGGALTATERTDLSRHVSVFDTRLQRANNAIKGLEANDISALSDIFKRSVPMLSAEALPLYIRGLAVRNEPNFNTIVSRINEWKGSARNRIQNRKATRYSNRLVKLSERYNIDSVERERLLNLSPADRQNELQSILGQERWWHKMLDAGNVKRILSTVTRFQWESREQQLGRIMGQYDQATEGVQQARAQLVGTLNNIDTTTDPFWVKIPELLRSRREEPRPAGQERLTLESGKQLVSPKGVNDFWLKELKEKGGDAAVTAWRAAQTKLSSGAITDIYAETFTPTGGSPQTFESAFAGVSSKIESQFTGRGFVNFLIELLFGSSIRSREITKSKDAIRNLKA